MQSEKDIYLQTLSARYFTYLVNKLNTVLSIARDKEYTLNEFSLHLDRLNYEAGKHILNEEFIKAFVHHYRIGNSVDTALQVIPALKLQYVDSGESDAGLVCSKTEKEVLKFLAKYAAIERFLQKVGYRDTGEDDFQQDENETENKKRKQPHLSSKIKRIKGDQLTKLSQEETALLGFLMQAERLFLSAEFLNKVNISQIIESATGYSSESIRKSLSELQGSRDKTVKEMYRNIKEVLLSMIKRIDKELGE